MQDSPDREGRPSVWGRVGFSSQEDPRSASAHITVGCTWGPSWWRARDTVFPIPSHLTTNFTMKAAYIQGNRYSQRAGPLTPAQCPVESGGNVHASRARTHVLESVGLILTL